jgi:hypothetical protein
MLRVFVVGLLADGGKALEKVVFPCTPVRTWGTLARRLGNENLLVSCSVLRGWLVGLQKGGYAWRLGFLEGYAEVDFF